MPAAAHRFSGVRHGDGVGDRSTFHTYLIQPQVSHAAGSCRSSGRNDTGFSYVRACARRS